MKSPCGYRLFVSLILLLYIGEVCDAYTIVVNGTAPDAVNNNSCWTDPPCSTLDLGLQGIANKSNVTLIVAKGHYNLSESLYTNFMNVSGISIIGSPSNDPPTTIVNGTGVGCVGFSFVHSSNISIHGIEFSTCNQLRNSTSYMANGTNKNFISFYVSFYFLYCSNVSLQNISITNNNGTGLVIYNPAGSIVIEGSRFIQNYYSLDSSFNVSGGGGVYIEFSYCVPYGDKNGIDCLKQGVSNVNPDFTSNSNISIVNCTFHHNKATITSLENNTFILPNRQYHAALGRGGGLSLFFKGNAQKNRVVVKKCIFERNQALWGGGVFAEFQDNATDNSVSIIDSCFSHNKVLYDKVENSGTGGGGSRVGYIFFDNMTQHGNGITFDGCLFNYNKALYGGGISFYSAQQIYNKTSLNALTINNSSFEYNKARLGAALDVSLWHPSISGAHPDITVSNSSFVNNTIFYPSGGVMGLGAVFIDSLPVLFKETVTFCRNNGSALVVTGSYVAVSENSVLDFVRNRGRNGAAMTLLGTSFVYMKRQSKLSFVDNAADYNGGAIFHSNTGERDLLSSRNCFIRYFNISSKPNEWQANFQFSGNTANGKSNAIHTSAVLPCLWGGGYGSANVSEETVNEVFCWGNWTYDDAQDNCSSYITTVPTNYTLHKSDYKIFPGQPILLNFSAYDDMHNNVKESTIFLGRIIMGNNTGSFLGYDTTHISHGHLYINGSNSTITVQLETEDPIVIRNNVTVTLKACPPTFTLNKEEGRCYCSGNFNSYINCNNASFSSTIIRGAWLGQLHGTNITVVGLSPYVDKASGYVYIDVPNESASNVFCDAMNRTGILCGKCKEGFGVAMNSPSFHCVSCKEDQVKYSWAYYLLTEFFMLTIFCLVIFVFGITVTMGPLNSYIFFAQVMTTTINVNSDGMIPLDTTAKSWGLSYDVLTSFYTIPYDVWNMNFLKQWLPKYCLSRDIDTVTVYALGYVTALYPLLLLAAFVGTVHAYSRGVRAIVYLLRPFHNCVSRIRQAGDIRQTVTGGVAAFIVISYTKFSFVSLSLLTPIPLYNASGGVVRQVFYLDGTIEFGNEKSLYYIVLAGFILGTFVAIPPLLLIYPSILKLIERASCHRIQLSRIYPSAKLQAFLDEFHGCYKDGTNGGFDCRWFAGLYFILRLMVFVIYSTTNFWQLRYVIQMLCFLATALLFALFKPYRIPWLNSLDVGMFLLLVAIIALSLSNLFLTRIDRFNEEGGWSFIVQYILIMVPLFYFIIYYGRQFLVHVISKCMPFILKRKQGNEVVVYDDERPALINSTHVPEFLEYVENTGRNSRVRLSNSTTWRHPGTHSGSNSSRSAGSNNEERTPLLAANPGISDDTNDQGVASDASSYHTPNPS